MQEKNNKKGKKLIILFVVLAIIALGVTVAYLYKDKLFNNNTAVAENIVNETKQPIVVEKEIQIYKGNDRPIAVMIDNHSDAMPHAGLNKAYIIYEIIVEGGESRLMAVFKGADVEHIGPVRSARHYFIDYALENDAIYTHYGWSPKAESDIKALDIANINGITASEDQFWRVSDKYAPHNVVTSTKDILKVANVLDYRTTSDTKSVLNYVPDEFNLDDFYSKEKTEEDVENTTNSISTQKQTITKAIKAEEITIPYSTWNKVKWEYDADLKKYKRYSKGEKEVEWYGDEEDFTAKNIIIEFIENWDLEDGEGKDRQNMDTTGEKDGYYITNGKAIKITCTKNSRSSKTVYKDLDGNEIKVNDGNTFVQICPINADVEIE